MVEHQAQAETGMELQSRSAAVSFVTTEHFTLQSARSATIFESTGRATMFLSAVSGGLIALGLIATATQVGTAFYAMALILLPALAFAGVVTFARVLQSGIEDLGYARRITLLRNYYFDSAPELRRYLLDIPQSDRPDHLHALAQVIGPHALRRRSGRGQQFVTIAGLVAVISSVLTGSAVGVLAAVLADHSLPIALLAGACAGAVVLAVLLRYQHVAWTHSATSPLTTDSGTVPPTD